MRCMCLPPHHLIRSNPRPQTPSKGMLEEERLDCQDVGQQMAAIIPTRDVADLGAPRSGQTQE